MRTDLKFPAIFIALILGAFLIVSLGSCHKNPAIGSIYGTYSGTSTNHGLVSGYNNTDTSIADSFIISAGTNASSDTVNVRETHFNVTMIATVSSNTDTLYISAQPVVYAGHSCTFSGTTGTIAGSSLFVSIYESINGVSAGTLVFEGTD